MIKPQRSFGKSFLLFLATILLITGILTLLNWIPSLMRGRTLSRYPTVDAAAKELRIGHIQLPAYIPEQLNLDWPPAEIYAQDTPFRAFIMHLRYRNSPTLGLVMHQIETSAPHRFMPRISLDATEPVRRVSVKDHPAMLLSGRCGDAVPCNQITWDDAGTTYTIVCKCSAQDIIKIAASCMPGP